MAMVAEAAIVACLFGRSTWFACAGFGDLRALIFSTLIFCGMGHVSLVSDVGPVQTGGAGADLTRPSR